MTSNEHKLARALVEAHVAPEVAPVVLESIDAWHAVVETAEQAIARAAAANVDEHLSVKQVAAWWNVSTDAIYKLVDTGHLPDRRVGGQIRIPVAACNRYLEENTTTRRVEPRPPRERRADPADVKTIEKYPWLKGA